MDYFPGDGSLTGINVTMYFGGATFNSAEWASDMLLGVKMLDGSACIIVGGFDYNIPGCDFVSYWPSSWETSEPGTYTHFIQLSNDYGLNGNNSYAVTIANGYKYGENPVYYLGNIVLQGIKYECYFPPATYILQVSNTGEPALMEFQGEFTGTQKICNDIYTNEDTSLENIIMNPLTFNANGYPGTWASDMFVTVTSLTSGSTEQECIQYGGYDYVVPNCANPSQWYASIYHLTLNCLKDVYIFTLSRFSSSFLFTQGNGRRVGKNLIKMGELTQNLLISIIHWKLKMVNPEVEMCHLRISTTQSFKFVSATVGGKAVELHFTRVILN